jgi:hypothetical protein
VLFPAFVYAYRLTGQNRADGALLLISSVIWAASLVCGAARGGSLLTIAVLLALWPVVLGLAYSSQAALLRIIGISIVVTGVAAVLNT